ncbi:MAG: hypothetical protein KDD47_12045, partial [Acidobacteria bacterium]|nr:hypothetical protein [Acidobacteriota bacterium]
MTVCPGQRDNLKPFRERAYSPAGDAASDPYRGRVFWATAERIAIFDPHAAHAVNAANFADLQLPETLFNLLLRRTSPPVYWKEVRDAWIEQVRRLSTPRELARLAKRMDQLLGDRAGEERDLVWVAHEVVSWSLLPTILE